MFKRILVPVDGSDKSTDALKAAVKLARTNSGRVRLLHAVDEIAFLGATAYSAAIVESARQRAGEVLAEGLALARSGEVQADSELIDMPAQRLGHTVADAAREWDADLIVVGTHGRRGIERVLLGSGAEQIIREAPVPVLVIR